MEPASQHFINNESHAILSVLEQNSQLKLPNAMLIKDYTQVIATLKDHSSLNAHPMSLSDELQILANVLQSLRERQLEHNNISHPFQQMQHEALRNMPSDDGYMSVGSDFSESIYSSFIDNFQNRPSMNTEMIDDDQTDIADMLSDSDFDSDFEEEHFLSMETVDTEESLIFNECEHVDRWKDMSDKEIVVDALSKGLTASAFTYMKWRHFSNPESSLDESNMGFTFRQFKRIAYSVVYDLIMDAELETAISIIHQIGEDTCEHFKEIAFGTVNSKVRNLLIDELSRRKALNKEEQSLVTFIRKLEEFYPQTSFWLAFKNSKYSKSRKNVSVNEEDSLFQCGGVDDCGHVHSREQELIIDPHEHKEALASEHSNRKRYLSLSLRWLRSWDHSSGDRVILERQRNFDQTASINTSLAFCMDNHNIPGIILWLRRLSFDGIYGEWNSNQFKIGMKSEHDSTQNMISLCRSIIDDIHHHFESSTSFLSQAISNNLARKGILIPIPSENQSKNDSLLRLLSSTFQLSSSSKMGPETLLYNFCWQSFGLHHNMDTSSAIDLRREILPQQKLSNFHQYFLEFCFQHDLSNVVEKYIHQFELWDSLKADIDHHGRHWAKMLLLSKDSKHLFESSLVNAQRKHDIPIEETMTLNKLLKSNDLMIFLATLMFLPVHPEKASQSSSSIEYYFDARLLKSLLKPYPTMRKVLMKLLNEPNNRSRKMSQDAAEHLAYREVRRGNFKTAQNDISAFDMLKEVDHIHLEDIMNLDDADPQTNSSQREENGVLPICLSEYESSAYTESLDVEYFLEKGRYVEAFEYLTQDVLGENLLFDTIWSLTDYEETISNCSNQVYQKLDDKQQSELLNTICSVSFHHVFEQHISNACVMFAELCDLDVQLLKTYIHTLKRIFEYHSNYRQESRQQQLISETIPLAVNRLGIHRDQDTIVLSKSHISKATQLFDKLEQATQELLKEWSLEPLNDLSDLKSKELIIPELYSEQKESETTLYISPWKVLRLFAKYHGFKPYKDHLELLATHNQWIAFLYESQQSQISSSEIYSIAKTHFNDPVIVQYVALTLKQVQSKNEEFNLSPSIFTSLNELNHEQSDKSKQIFDILFMAEQKTYRTYNSKGKEIYEPIHDSAQFLLKQALEIDLPLLCVFAPCFNPQMNLCQCLIAWLIACKPMLGMKKRDFELSASFLEHSSQNDDLWELLDALIIEYRVHQSIFYLIRGFRLFDEHNILILVFEFIRDFEQCRFQACESKFKSFVAKISANNNSSSKEDQHEQQIGSLSWLSRIADKFIDSILKSLPTKYEQQMLLRILTQYEFGGTRYLNVYRVLSLLEQNNQITEDIPIRDIMDHPESIIDTLMSKNEYNSALQVVNLLDLDSQRIHVLWSKTITLLENVISTALWKYKEGRSQLWDEIDQLLKLNQTHASVKSVFIVKLLMNMEKNDTHLSSAEAIMELFHILLRYLREWNVPHHQNLIDYINRSITLLRQTHSSITGTENESLEQVSSSSSLSVSSLSSSQKALDSVVKGIIMRAKKEIISSCHDEFAEEVNDLFNVDDSDKIHLDHNEVETNNITDSHEAQVISEVIDSVLFEGNLEEAKSLCSFFGYSHPDFYLSQTAASLAKGTMVPERLPQELKAKIASKELNSPLKPKTNESYRSPSPKSSPRNSSSSHSLEHVQQVLDKLPHVCQPSARGVAGFCRRVALLHRISMILDMDYQNAMESDPYELLHLLLLCGRDRFKLCSSFISVFDLKTKHVSQTCATFIFHAFTEHYESLMSEAQERIDSSRDSNSNDSEVSSDHSNHSSINAEIENRSKKSIKRKLFAASIESESFEESTDKEPETEEIETPSSNSPAQWSKEVFSEFAHLCRDLSQLAEDILERLMKFINDNVVKQSETTPPSPRSPHNTKRMHWSHNIRTPLSYQRECEVELLIRVYWCHSFAFSIEGTNQTMNLVHTIATDLIRQQEFWLLVRLLIAIPNYTELEYIFDVLVEYEQFELILQRVPAVHENQMNDLKSALASYLKSKYPNNSERLKMVYQRFHMQLEQAEMFLNQANQKIDEIAERIKLLTTGAVKSNKYSSSLQDEIEEAKQLLSHAVNGFYQIESYTTVETCYTLIGLLSIQNRYPQTLVLRLTKDEARTVMMLNAIFEESLLVATAYDLNHIDEWIAPVYRQVVEEGRIEYFHAFRNLCHPNDSIYFDLVKYFQTQTNSSTSSHRVHNLKALIRSCPDYSVQQNIAKKFNWQDILEETAQILNS